MWVNGHDVEIASHSQCYVAQGAADAVRDTGLQKFSPNFSDIKQRIELNANSLAVTVDAATGCPAAGDEYPGGTGIAGVGKHPGTLYAPVIG